MTPSKKRKSGLFSPGFETTVLKHGGRRRLSSSTSSLVARPSEFADVLRELGLRIQQARIVAGLTQEQAASDSAIDYKRWQRLEEGSVNPTVKTLHRVSVALDMPFWELFTPPPRRPRISGEMPRTRDSKAPASRRAKSRG